MLATRTMLDLSADARRGDTTPPLQERARARWKAPMQTFGLLVVRLGFDPRGPIQRTGQTG